MTLEEALEKVREFYEIGEKDGYVKWPLAWALYHTWRIADVEREFQMKEEKNEGNNL